MVVKLMMVLNARLAKPTLKNMILEIQGLRKYVVIILQVRESGIKMDQLKRHVQLKDRVVPLDLYHLITQTMQIVF